MFKCLSLFTPLRHVQRSFGLLVTLLYLTGCATIHPHEESPLHPDKTSIPLFSKTFYVVGSWTLEGNRKASGQFDWHHSPHEDELILLGPFSLPIAKIIRHDQETFIQTADGKRLTEQQWERASADLLGNPLALPLHPLSAWIQGAFYDKMPPGKWLSDPHPPMLRSVARQENWHIVWLKTALTHLRPDRVELSPPQLPYRLLLDIHQESSLW